MRHPLLLVFLIGCTRAAPQSDTVIVPPVTLSAVPVSSSSAVPSTPKTTPHDLTIVGGDLVDLGAMSARPLTPDMIFSFAIAGDTAYVWVRSELRAYETSKGTLRWAKPLSDCWSIAASNAGVFCGSASGAQWYAKSDGSSKTVGTATPISALSALGNRIVVLHSDLRLESLDEMGAIVGSTKTPVPADRGYTRASLMVAGTLACGAQRSDAACEVFCVDATPRIVWTRRVAVPGGLVRQLDADVMLVTADEWTKSSSSEVVRTSDGSTLLHSSAKLAAALTTTRTFDGALSSGKAITYYDAKGATKWSSTTTPFHDEMLRAARSGTNIVIAQYSSIATGTQLQALNESTGVLVWHANVDSLPISHSKYSNEVDLRSPAKSILLLGHESSQDYAQWFEPSTGVRIQSILRGR
jgi:outer membrane protein assembly factor BamB